MMRGTPPCPDLVLLDMFSSRAARTGAVIRRKSRDTDRLNGPDTFLREPEQRGYRAAENAVQIVIFCNNEPVRPLV